MNLPPEKDRRSNGRSASELWAKLNLYGIGERFLKTASVVVTLLLVTVILWVTGTFFLKERLTVRNRLVRCTYSVCAGAVLPIMIPLIPREPTVRQRYPPQSRSPTDPRTKHAWQFRPMCAARRHCTAIAEIQPKPSTICGKPLYTGG